MRLWPVEPAGRALVLAAEEPTLLAPPESDCAAAGASELDGLLLWSYLSSAAYASSHLVTTP